MSGSRRGGGGPLPLQNLNCFKLHYKIELPNIFLGTPTPLKNRRKILDPRMINDAGKN